MGISRRTVLAGAAASVAAPAVATPAAASSDVVAITGVTVIDAHGRRRGQTVLMRGGRILDTGRISVPHDARVLDGRGKYLIPGLADMHTHATGIDATEPEMYVVNGVTTTREMSANEPAIGWQREIDSGVRVGPRWIVGSAIVDGSPSLWEGLGVPYVAVADAAEARAAVRAQAAAGAAFIKTYSRLSRESFHAIAAESRRAGLPFLGHVPDFVPVTEASDAGLHTIEHLFEFWYDTSRDEEWLRREIARIRVAGGDYAGWFTRLHPVEFAAARSHDRDKAARLFERLARNGTRVTPTLTVHWTCDTPQDVPHDDPRFRYVSADTLAYWQWCTDTIYLKGRTAKESAERQELFVRRLRLAGEMARAGVPLMTGTDLGTSYLMPGFSLHDELRLLVRAGVSTAQVLRAATLEPALSLGRHDQGLVTRGHVADLVLLDADPLRDIAATAQINSVVVRGKLIDAAARQRMLAGIEAAARAKPATGVLPVAAGCACHAPVSRA
ncbi:amidohydrolase family protein [Paractinoplanes lichenicola]|uniref:Amidohydrolase family protein n=1 Tax=Paractinoplanes lichenicola TaxID=2802976 RepID=A0ABS1W393_9ACTN|nr:amidohydrolase family protein [Actinoplanes lichenicola]MBL7261189.1 amidohydrolase family protein [Actinoplanes lichenicola]